jgi:hypothetical protein
MIRSAVAASCAGLCLLACSNAVDVGRRCPHDNANCDAMDSGSGGRVAELGDARSTGDGRSANGAGSNDLGVDIRDIDGLPIDVVTLRCPGDCADVVALPRGGNPPYVLRWDDGSTSAKRRVCLQADRTLTIAVMDTKSPASEPDYRAHTSMASLEARVLQCSSAVDGGPGASTAPEPDAGDSVMCVQGSALRATDDCRDLDSIECGSLPSTHRSFALRADLSPGKTLCLRMSDIGLLAPGKLTIWGGADACARAELLEGGEVTAIPAQLVRGSAVCVRATNGTYRHLTIGDESGSVSAIKFEQCAKCSSVP